MSNILLLRFVPRYQVVFEVESTGTEFYMVLDGEVDVYTRGNGKDETVKAKMEEIKKEKEIPIVCIASRQKSSYPGVPPVKKLKKTELKLTTSGINVYYDG